MRMIDWALGLAGQGFYVFPIKHNCKTPPLIADFANKATRDVEQIKKWFSASITPNIGIYTGKFGDNSESLLVVDVDVKKEKNGLETIELLKLQGLVLPETYVQTTPTGGKHIVYKTKTPVGVGVEVFGQGLDLRGTGGYIVGAGSLIDGKQYTQSFSVVADAPEFLLKKAKPAPSKKEKIVFNQDINQESAVKRGLNYLLTEAPIALEGENGDQTTFKVACHLKDLGIFPKAAFSLMADHWNSRCQPPWDLVELEEKVQNAFRYGSQQFGSKNPEVIFKDEVETDETKSPIEKLNDKYAFVVLGGKERIIRFENKDFIQISTLHCIEASNLCDTGKKPIPWTRLWMSSPERKSFDNVVFDPSNKSPANYYNLWKGFSVKPRRFGKHEGVKMFIDHTLKNVCDSKHDLFSWLMGYFAHLFQKPWEKPLTAVVLRGPKGVGKNAFIDRIGYLLGEHYALVSNRRYLFGNFNSFRENNLMFVLDEAFWSGDKAGEGILKDVITGDKIMIERKGYEPYQVKNYSRTIVLGNEDWLVPASNDERRFAVFDVKSHNKQDTEFFSLMRELLEQDGYPELLDYFLSFDLRGININVAPKTDALLDQKVSSFSRIESFWHDCLSKGFVSDIGFSEEWPEKIRSSTLRNAYGDFCRRNGDNRYIENEVHFGRKMFKICPSLKNIRFEEGDSKVRGYLIPPLSECRDLFSKYVNHEIVWDNEK